MSKATLTSKGQITIPVDIRIVLGLEAGDSLEFTEMTKGKYVMTISAKPVQKLKGIITKKGAPVSVEAMNVAIAARGAGQL